MPDNSENMVSRIRNLSVEKRAQLAQQITDLRQPRKWRLAPEAAPSSRQKNAPGSQSAANGQLLSAFVVLQPGKTVTTDDLRQYLIDKLPEYMIPSAITVLEQLPQTPNGKVDRKKLAEMIAPQVAQKPYVAPQNAVQEVLQLIWQEVLELENIGVHDNFFQLGGHSLLVTMLIAKTREIFQTGVSLRSIFDAPTIAELAEWLLQDVEQHPKIEKTAQLYLQLSRLSEEEAEAMLTQKQKP